MNLKHSEKYKHCNHHHELTEDHELVDFNDGEFVANKEAIPILKALNDLGLKTRTHHVDNNGGFVSILLNEKIRFEIRKVYEKDADRDRYNGETELLINWRS